MIFTVVVVGVAEAAVGHVLHVVVLDQDLIVVAVPEGREAGQDLLASDLTADLVANQCQGIDQNPEIGLGNVPEIDQDLDHEKDQGIGQGKGHVVIQVAQ